LIVLITASLALVLGAGGVALVYQQQVIPGIMAKMQQQGPPGSGAPAGPPPAQVRVAAMAERSLKPRFEVVGRLQELERTTVAAEVSGKLVAVPVEEGDRVEAGQTTLAKVEDVWAKLDLEAATADVAAAEATLDQSQRDLQYLEKLLEANSAKPKEVADQRASVKSDRATLDAAKARRARARQRVNRLTVTPPFDGVVVDKRAEVGQWVEPGTTVVEMVSRGQIDAVLNVPEKRINTVQVGDLVTVVVEPLAYQTNGEVVAVNPSGDNPARTFPVKVRLDDAKGKLKPGMSAIGQLPLAEAAQRLTVPRAAVSFGPRGASIWVAQPPAPAGVAPPRDGEGAESGDSSEEGASGPPAMPKAKRVDVEVLFPIEGGYAIKPVAGDEGADLNADQRVVIEGWERLMPGQPLKIVGTGEPKAARLRRDAKPLN
jgi:RND family efflux transporter MFP subunit